MVFGGACSDARLAFFSPHQKGGIFMPPSFLKSSAIDYSTFFISKVAV